MSGRRTNVLDVREIVRQIRAGESDRAIAKALSVSRRTVKKYRQWADKAGLLAGDLPPADKVHALLQSTIPDTGASAATSSISFFQEKIRNWREQGLEVQVILQRLQEQHNYDGSYSTVWRFVRRLEPATPDVTVRVETKPGEEAQVDFGYAGLIRDPQSGQMRKAWVFVMTLSWSRHQYVELVFDQSVETWLKLHINGFAYFSGVPQRIVLDNLKAGIVRASVEDPVVQRSYRDLAEHYNFLVAPNRPRTPQHKGKVESGVHYVERNFLAGQTFADLTEANVKALSWVEKTASQRIHGTTKAKPIVRFEGIEKAVLQPLPATPYDLAVWKQVLVHRDCYVVFEKAYYSAPFRLVGQQVWVRGGLQSVQIFSQYALMATHQRAKAPGERFTNPDHLPTQKAAGLLNTREACQARANEIGIYTAEVVARLLAERPVDRLRMVWRILRLAEEYGTQRLERACMRALHFEDCTARTIRQIMEKNLDLAAVPAVLVESTPLRFGRSANELLPGIGDLSWN